MGNKGGEVEDSYRLTLFIARRTTDIRKISLHYFDIWGITILTQVGGCKAYETAAKSLIDHCMEALDDDDPTKELLRAQNYKKIVCIEKIPSDTPLYYNLGDNGEIVFWYDEYGNIAYENPNHDITDTTAKFTIFTVPYEDYQNNSSKIAAMKIDKKSIIAEKIFWGVRVWDNRDENPCCIVVDHDYNYTLSDIAYWAFKRARNFERLREDKEKSAYVVDISLAESGKECFRCILNDIIEGDI